MTQNSALYVSRLQGKEEPPRWNLATGWVEETQKAPRQSITGDRYIIYTHTVMCLIIYNIIMYMQVTLHNM